MEIPIVTEIGVRSDGRICNLLEASIWLPRGGGALFTQGQQLPVILQQSIL